jgi:hypothetical protein
MTAKERDRGPLRLVHVVWGILLSPSGKKGIVVLYRQRKMSKFGVCRTEPRGSYPVSRCSYIDRKGPRTGSVVAIVGSSQRWTSRRVNEQGGVRVLHQRDRKGGY